MKSEKNFPNGFDEWTKTHFQITSRLVFTTHVNRTQPSNSNGTKGYETLYTIAFQMTDAFEQEKADGDSSYTIEGWVAKYTKLFISMNQAQRIILLNKFETVIN